MNDPRRRDILRFSALLSGLTPLAGCGGGGGDSAPVAPVAGPTPAPPPQQPAPAPPAPTPPAPPAPTPPAPSPPASPAPPPVASSGARQFSLLSGVTATAPFCVGFALKQGDIPSGSGIAVTGATAQVTVKNTWPDGSAKFALVAGTASLTAGVAATVALAAGTSSTGTALTLADLQAAMSQPVTVTCGSFGSASWSGADWAIPFETWVVGHRMSSWVYRKPVGSDAHLVAWLEVRLFSTGEVEVLPWVENGYVLVAGPTSKSGTYSFVMGGSSRFSAAIVLPHHCRTVLIAGSLTSHWLGSAHDLVVKHDGRYMSSTGLVPAYFANTPASASAVTAMPGTFAPLQQGIWPNVMGSGGYSRSIGLLPEWDVAHLTSAATSTYKGIIFQAYSAGRYPYHFRDESSQRPARLSQYPTLQIRDPLGGYVTPPLATGTAPPVYSVSHQPAMAVVAYLVTGRRYFLDEMQFVASFNSLNEVASQRNNADGVIRSDVAGSVRHMAWTWRSLVQALAITPDADTVYLSEYRAQLTKNIDYYHARYVAQPNNPQGWVQPYEPAGAYGTSSIWFGATWMQDFVTAVWGYSKDLGLGLANGTVAKLDALFAWKAGSIVGRLGTAAPSDYLYRDYCPYTISLGPSGNLDFAGGTGPWHTTWGQVYDSTFSGAGDPSGSSPAYLVPGPRTDGGFRLYMNPEFPSAIALPAIAYAVKHNVAGAADAYARLRAAAGWSAFETELHSTPVWAVASAS